jgi:hypothetical protein
MVRWIAFDDETAEAVVSRFKRGAAEIQRGEPLDAVLQAQRPSVIVLPSDIKGQAVIAHFSRRTASAPSEAAPIEIEATGFLGLADGPVSHEPAQEARPKKKWWRNQR